MHFTIIGGGTSGWIASLYLISLPNIKVTLIADEEIGILGVGESTTAVMSEVIDSIDVDWSEFWKRTGSMPKMVKKFINWNGEGSVFYCPIDGSETQSKVVDEYTYLLLNEGIDPSLSAESRLFHQNNILDFTEDGVMRRPFSALHLDTHKTAEFLKEKAIERGVDYVCGQVRSCSRDEKGNVLSVDVNGTTLKSDYWIDASGQRRVLSNHIPFRSFKEFLPVNRAISTVTGRSGIYVSETTSTALSAGWAWDIPTRTRRGVGYVYCDEFISEEEAVRELSELIDEPVTEYKTFTFESGILEKVWNHNVISIGMSSGFLEPLQATSIHTTIIQLSLLREQFKDNHPDPESFNQFSQRIMTDFRDLVNLTYAHQGIGTPFWKSVRITDRNQKAIEKARSEFLGRRDFQNYRGAAGIGVWMSIFTGLSLIPPEVPKKFEENDSIWYQLTKKRYNEFTKETRDKMNKSLSSEKFEQMYG